MIYYQLILTQRCNLSCDYCIQKEKNNIESMSKEILYKSCDFIVNDYNKRNNDNQTLIINITGGEPLLEFNLVKEGINYLKSILKKNKINNFQFELSTNGLLLNDDNINFVKENFITLFIGFDGLRESHDKNRKMRNNYGSFNKLFENLNKYCLSDEELKLRTTLNYVISPNNVKYLTNNFKYLFNLMDGKNVSINIAYDQKWDSFSIKTLEEQLALLAEMYIYILKINSFYSLKIFDSVIRRCIKNEPYKTVMCDAGIIAFSINTDGNILPCSGLTYIGIPEKDVIIGNVLNGIDNNKLELFRAILDNMQFEDCIDCYFKNKCLNYCPSNNFLSSGNMNIVSEYYCEISKTLIFQCINIIDVLYKNHKDLYMKKYLN